MKKYSDTKEVSQVNTGGRVKGIKLVLVNVYD